MLEGFCHLHIHHILCYGNYEVDYDDECVACDDDDDDDCIA